MSNEIANSKISFGGGSLPAGRQASLKEKLFEN
jgi:hypothetical protein